MKTAANADTLTSSATGDIESLTKKDIIVFWGGTNDVRKNNSRDAFKDIVKFVEINSHTNIIVMSVPQRHDLCDWSCVNPEVKTFNINLVNLMKSFKHVTVTKVQLQKKFFTRQCLTHKITHMEKFSHSQYYEVMNS